MSDAPPPEQIAAIEAGHARLVRVANEMNGVMIDHDVDEELRARVILSALATTLAAALESWVAAEDRHRVMAELSRRIHVALLSGLTQLLDPVKINSEKE